MSDYRVNDVLSVETKQKKDGSGTFRIAALQLEGEQGTVEYLLWNANQPAPEPGTTLSGEIERNNFGATLKPVRAPRSNGFKGGRSPEETKAIQRQHSQEMALRWTAIQAQRGKVPDGFSYEQLKPIIDWFEKDIA